MSTNSVISTDWTLTDPKDRVKRVELILSQSDDSSLSPSYLTKLATYITYPIDKEARRQHNLLTENRQVTISRRECSLDGLLDSLENSDSLYHIIANDRNIIFSPRDPITAEDIDSIPPLSELRDAISLLEQQLKASTGQKAFSLKKQIIEMYKDQYIIRDAYRKPVHSVNIMHQPNNIDLSGSISRNDDDGTFTDTSFISLFNPTHVSILLNNYSRIKQETWEDLDSDFRWLMLDLDTYIEAGLAEDYPIYLDILIHKIDGLSNDEIRNSLSKKWGTTYTNEYISTLWRSKIPKLIAEAAIADYEDWYFLNLEKGQYKKC